MLPEGLNTGVVWVGVVVLRVLTSAATRLVLLVSQLGVSRLDPAKQKGQRSKSLILVTGKEKLSTSPLTLVLHPLELVVTQQVRLLLSRLPLLRLLLFVSFLAKSARRKWPEEPVV